MDDAYQHVDNGVRDQIENYNSKPRYLLWPSARH